MAYPARRGGSAEHKVRHRRIEEEKIIDEMYQFGKTTLGKGSFGIVVEAKNLETNERWAVKMVNKEKAGSSAITLLEREVSILKRVKHDHIIHLEEVFESPKKVYLVMELCELGELRTILFKHGPFSEDSARHVIRDLANAIVYLHKNGIVHRDLKLENILIAGCRKTENEDPLYDIKLTDFGLSVVKGGAGSESLLQSSCGTPVYMAPEVVQHHDYSQQCDNWSIGVIMYTLLAKDFPFVADKEERLFELIKKGEVDFSKPRLKDVSKPAKTLIGYLLTLDPAHRYTASEVTTHPWILGREDSAPNPRNVLAMMKDYAKEMANNIEEKDEFAENSDDTEQDSFGSEDSRRPVTTGSPLGTRVEKAHSKKNIKSAPLSSQNPNNTLPTHRTVSTHLQPPNDVTNSRRGSLPALKQTVGKKTSLASSPRKIYDNKSIGRQTSPVSSSLNPASKSVRSPVQSARERGNGSRLAPATDHSTVNNGGHGKHKADTSHRGSNRPTTPGSTSSLHISTSGRSQSPHSPLLNHRHSHERTDLHSAHRNRKKKPVNSTKP